ncbi:hypothetical protein MB84_12770 [Pandoraea oxalativorans]|uniref:Uncharacterized protein n=1 Tax=Pandoraea oxalativorans TaxID=573737 RepID=A0A0E3YBI0_9BURK|nr:hypothetical protein MB84_12770 [Pandoraea oxalativorans]
MLLSGGPLSCECGHSFGSDFARLGAAPPAAAGSLGKAWQTYPQRTRTVEDSSGVSIGRWQAYREIERVRADDLMAQPLVAETVKTRIENWHTLFQRSLEHDISFEDKRTEAMQQVRYGVPPENRAFVRTFDSTPVVRQLGEIAHVNDELDRMTQATGRLPKGPAKLMGLQYLADMARMRDTMLALTVNIHDRKFNELTAERNLLIALNDMAREAQREMSRGGADVPLRLKIRGGKVVLKPATSKSRFQKNHIRARNDAARLALLLGYPADRTVTLNDIRARGLGLYEYSAVLADAKASPPGQTASWLGARAREIDQWKHAARELRDDLRHTDGGRMIGAPSESAHDDAQFDEVDAWQDVSELAAIEGPVPVTTPKRLDTRASPIGTSNDEVSPVPTGSKATAANGAQKNLRAQRAPAVSVTKPAKPTQPKAQPTSRREQFVEQFIGTHQGRAGRLSVILERSRSVERLAEQPDDRDPGAQRAHPPVRRLSGEVGSSMSRSVRRPAGPTVDWINETPEQMAWRTGARPKTYRALPLVADPSDTQAPALPMTPPPRPGISHLPVVKVKPAAIGFRWRLFAYSHRIHRISGRANPLGSHADFAVYFAWRNPARTRNSKYFNYLQAFSINKLRD